MRLFTLITVSLLFTSALLVRAEAQPKNVETAEELRQRMLPKPAVFNSWSERADFLNHNVPLVLDAHTFEADTMFLPEGVALSQEKPSTRLRLGLYTFLEEDEGFSIRFDPDFEVDVKLPNLEDNWQVFFNGTENAELPGTDPTDRERGAQLGVRRALDNFSINLDAGIKVKWIPEAFAKIEWNPDFFVGKWRIMPRQRVFYETDDGFGEITSLGFLRWIGGRRNFVFHSLTAGKWTEVSEGFEWEQTLKLGYIRTLLDESKRGQTMISKGDATQGVGIRYSVFGHIDGEGIMDRHRVNLVHRRPLYKDWLFLEFSPQLEWKNDNDWDLVPGLLVGLDMLFWGK